MASPPSKASSRRELPSWLIVAVALVVLNGGVLLLAWALRQTVMPAWKKGPLIDPASPYSPENAQVLFALGVCVWMNTYLLGLTLWRRYMTPRWWIPTAALALSAVVAEGSVQAYLAVDMVTYFRPHPTLHWVVRPDLDRFDNLTGGGTITTNEHGMREVDVPVEKPADEYRILVLGDSSNFGHGVEGDEMWSSVLEDILRPRADDGVTIRVLNASCPGWTTYQALEILDSYALSYQPDMVIAGFNNDPNTDYMPERERVQADGLMRDLNALAFHSELYLLSREAVLSFIRRFSPEAQRRYTERSAGDDPNYFALSSDEKTQLVPRIARDEFLENLTTLQTRGVTSGYDFVWLNMPVTRTEPVLVKRYVDWSYREGAAALSEALGFPLIDVNDRWMRSGEVGLHIAGHVFHPNAQGHHRMGEQIAAALIDAALVPASETPKIGGPPPASAPGALRFGWSSVTPLHAAVGLVLRDHPELPARHDLVIDPLSYDSGKTQGRDVADGVLDAFFTCEVPAVQMLRSRSDARVVASPGALGRIAVVARADRAQALSELRGKKVGLAEGSTPAMDWARWGEGLDAEVVPLKTDDLKAALDSGRVDAVVSWDPWVSQWEHDAPGELAVLAEREFRSAIAVSARWALSQPPEQPAATQRLVDLVSEALAIAAADRPRYDAAIAALSGWPIEVVRDVLDANEHIKAAGDAPDGVAIDLSLAPIDRAGLEASTRFATDGHLQIDQIIGVELLSGEPPPGYNPHARKGGPPGKSPPKGPPRDRP